MHKTAAEKAVLVCIFEAWQDELEQLFALVSSIESGLNPDSNAPEVVLNQWRLSQVALDMLGSTGDFNALKRAVGLTDDKGGGE